MHDITSLFSGNELKSINGFIDEYKCDFGIVVSNAERPSLITEKLIALPFASL